MPISNLIPSFDKCASVCFVVLRTIFFFVCFILCYPSFAPNSDHHVPSRNTQIHPFCANSRSPTSPTSWNEEESRPISPVSSQMQPKPSFLDGPDVSGPGMNQKLLDQGQITKPPSFDIQHSQGSQAAPQPPPHIHQTQNLLMTSVDSTDAASTTGGVALNDDAKSNTLSTGGGAGNGGEFNENDVGNVETETKSISSLKSIGSTQDR